MLDRVFRLSERGTTVGTEVKGGAVHPMMHGAALAFLVYFALPWLRALLGF